MSNGWTEERRRKQAEAIKQWQPWAKSTGPKTKTGKERASLNALKTGDHSLVMARWRDVLKINAEFLVQIEQAVAFEDKRYALECKLVENELLDKRLKEMTLGCQNPLIQERTNGLSDSHNHGRANHDP